MLSDSAKQAIQQAYNRFLENKGWVSRRGQRQMIAEIARTLGGVEQDEAGCRSGSAPHVCVVEAGTGTGKTVAYALAAIPLAKELNKSLVISTATVALQEQIILKDLPDLRRQSGLAFEFALAKGRSRYLCPAKLDTQLEGADLDPTLALYPDEMPVQASESDMALFRDMASAMAAGRWDGDRDAWPKHIDPQAWTKVTTDHRQCAGRRCAYISQCPFYKARDTVQGVDVVVANHDLVLADLALGGGAILPEPEQTIYIFDEGHHLADKAIDHFAFHSRIDGTRKWLKQSEKSVAAMAKVLGSGIGGTGALLEQLQTAGEQAQQVLGDLFRQLEEQVVFPDKPRRYRFPHGLVPENIRTQASVLAQLFTQMTTLLGDVNDHLKEALDGNISSIPRHELEIWYPAVGAMLSRAEANQDLWQGYAITGNDDAGAPRARWITLLEDKVTRQQDFELCSSPIQAASTLAQTLWSRCFAAVVTSATLTALNRFDRFRFRTGTPENANYVAIASPFDFQRAEFVVPPLSADPSDADAHTSLMVEYVRNSVNFDAGTLVLFSSRRQMEGVYDGLERELQKKILLQGDLSKQEMVTAHKKRIDAGAGSVLFGLASFAEGVDLPGNYCTHVVIARIPFAVPDDPVEEAMAEWVEKNGGNPFMEIAVPDAAMKLVQACGRLLRNEQDSGTITLLDRRLVSKRYGQAILDSLPPYKRKIAR